MIYDNENTFTEVTDYMRNKTIISKYIMNFLVL